MFIGLTTYNDKTKTKYYNTEHIRAFRKDDNKDYTVLCFRGMDMEVYVGDELRASYEVEDYPLLGDRSAGYSRICSQSTDLSCLWALRY